MGPGYMPKGGPSAAARHNERLARSSAPVDSAPEAVRVADAERTDGRASDRSAARRTSLARVVALPVGSAVLTTVLVESVLHALGR